LTDNLTETRLAIQSWQFCFTIPLRIRLTIPLYNLALQFSFTIQFTISTYNFVWQIRTYNSAWPKWVKRSERLSSDSTMVQSGCRVLRRKRVSRAEAFTGGR